jgi:hypothetical protein
MEAKDKAESILQKFTNLINYDFVTDREWHNPMDEERNERVKKDAKKCALALIDEIEHNAKLWGVVSVKGYWVKVRKELDNL